MTVSRTSLTMKPGQSETLTATVAPDAAENTAVTWSSNNPSIATVTSGGRVNALAGGDVRGTFSPHSCITRQECAAIVSRMAESNSRISFSLGG